MTTGLNGRINRVARPASGVAPGVQAQVVGLQFVLNLRLIVAADLTVNLLAVHDPIINASRICELMRLGGNQGF
jgi:hypothetical protein